MPFGRLENVRPKQIFQNMEFSMSWMVEHFYNAFHDPAVLHGDICHQYTEYVASKLVVFDGDESTNTTSEAVRRKGRCNCDSCF